MKSIYNIYEAENGHNMAISFYHAYTSKAKAIEALKADINNHIDWVIAQYPDLNDTPDFRAFATFEEYETPRDFTGSWRWVFRAEMHYKLRSSRGEVFTYNTIKAVAQTKISNC